MLSKIHTGAKTITRVFNAQQQHMALGRAIIQARAAQKDRPSNAAEVVSWAQQQFLQEVSRDKPDGSINLAKVCMLLALEEEASGQLANTPATFARTSATASTWSLNRINALAAEVVDTLLASTLQVDTPDHNTTHTASTATGTAGTAGTEHAAAAAAAITPLTSRGHTSSPYEVAPDDTHNNSTSSSMIQGSSGQQVPAATAAAFTAVRQQAERYPMQVLTALNDVLFRRHGYSACNRFGVCVDSQLSAVLEDGPGSVAALTILYLEVCSRLGLQCGFKVVEEGRYCLLWPTPTPTRQQQQGQEQQQQAPVPQPHADQYQQQQQTLLSVGGAACVIDVYGEGALLPVREATELFGITDRELFAGGTRRELLAALLAELQRGHWCDAVGCSPSPALSTPLTAGTAVGGAIQQLHGASIERAAAAAGKRVVLLPHDPQAQLELALLCYFSGRYDDAWLELGSYLEQLRAAAQREQQQQQLLQQQRQQCGQQQQQGEKLQKRGGDEEPSPAGGYSSSSSGSSGSGVGTAAGSSSALTRVSELHAAIQSMLIGGEVVPDPPPPTAALTAAEAALASADEEGADSRARKQEERELGSIVLLFHKLQLELMVAANKQG